MLAWAGLHLVRCGCGRALALAVALAAALLLPVAGLHAQPLQPVPALAARVIDQTGTLTAADVAAIDAKLAAFEAEAGPQIVVLMVATTAPEDIAAFAFRVADAWKIGRREVGDGLLVLVAKDDRRMRIEVARALEGAVPDLAARQIIDRVMAPAFRNGDFAGGIGGAIDQLIARIRGENLPAPDADAGASGPLGLPLGELAMFFFVAVPVVGSVLTNIVGRKLGSLATAGVAGAAGWWFSASIVIGVVAAVAALIVVGIFGIGAAGRRIARQAGRGGPPFGGGWGGGSGGGWGGGGGGGFSSGGGGSFGGGGSSGSW